MTLEKLLNVISDESVVYVWAYSIEDPDSVILVGMQSNTESVDPMFRDCEIDYISAPAENNIDVNIHCEVTSDEAIDTEE